MTSRCKLNIIGSAGLAFGASIMPSAALAQAGDPSPMSEQEIATLPAEYQSAPARSSYSETRSEEDGVETITRTRRIERVAPAPAYADPAPVSGYGYAPSTYVPAPAVFEREQWIEECNRRTAGRSEEDKGGIIGGLLGAVTGGILGNRIADGDRLAGTLIGAGTGGLGGFLLGSLIGGGKKEDAYDCEAALDSYLSQYGTGPARIASRTIPAPTYPQYTPQGAYNYAPVYGYGYAPPQRLVYVPIRYEQQQRVIIRETIREEYYDVPAEGTVTRVP